MALKEGPPVKKLPKKIELCGMTWKVVVDPEADDHGECRSDSLTIMVKKEGDWSTFFHECLHAVLFMTGQNETLSEKQEEGLVRALEHFLFPHIQKRTFSPK